MKDTQQPPRIPEFPVYWRGDPNGFVVAGTYRVLGASMYNGEVHVNIILPSGHMEFARAASLAPDIASDRRVIELVEMCREARGTPIPLYRSPAPDAVVEALPEGCPETAFFDPMDGQIHSDEQSGEEVVVEIHPVGTRARLAATAPPSAPCVWKEGQDGEWCSVCGIVWTFHDGGPNENGVNDCPACTGPLGPEACEEGSA